MKKFIFILLAAFSIQGCKEIIAENISGRTPEIIIPGNGQTVNQNPVHFKWEPMSGATKYRLQIASPNFANIEVYALDSIIAGTNFIMALDSNEYELKLTAMNAGYTSNTLSSVYFTVGTSPSGGGGSVVLLETPADSAFFKSFDGFDRKFNWADFSGASHYEFYLKKGTSFSTGDLLHHEPHVNLSTFTAGTTNYSEGAYHWGVRAYLEGETETLISKSKFFIDTTKPNLPVLITPNSSQAAGNITFTWNNGTDPGNIHAPINSVIEISDNQEFTQNLETHTVTGSSATISLIGSGQRYWRMKNIDEAGNESAYSTFKSFMLL